VWSQRQLKTALQRYCNLPYGYQPVLAGYMHITSHSHSIQAFMESQSDMDARIENMELLTPVQAKITLLQHTSALYAASQQLTQRLYKQISLVHP
jgi:hypothetical protein